MKNKTTLTIILSFICFVCLSFGFSSLGVLAQETVRTAWVVDSSAPDLSVSDVADGGVGKISYKTVPGNSLLNAVTVPIKNYDIVDDYMSIKYKADFPVTGTNITIYLNYLAGADTTTGEDYPAGSVLVGWFENWNVEKGKTRDGFDFITVYTGTYTTDKTVSGVTLSFSYLGSATQTKTLELFGIDFHPENKTPKFVTDSDPVQGSIVLGTWVPDAEVGNMQYKTEENGNTTIYYASKPTGKSRIVAPITGHEVDLLPQLKIYYSCTKDFNLAVYINGTSTSLQSYTNITDNEGVISFDLTKTMTKLCVIVDRSNYCDSSTYTSEDPTKTIYLHFAFVDTKGNEIKVVSVANNNSESISGGGSSGGSGSCGNEGENNQPTVSGNITIGAWAPDDGAGNIQYSKDAQGRTVIHYPAAPTGKGRIIASVEGHSLAQFPTLRVTYSCTKAFNLAVYVNGTSKSLLSYTNITDNEGFLLLDITKRAADMTKLCIIVDRIDYYDSSTYTTEDPTKTIYFTFEFLDKDGNVAGSEGAGGGQGSNPPTVVGNVTMGSWIADDGIGNTQYSKDDQGRTVISYTAEPTGKSRIYASVEGHSLAEYPILKVTYSCAKAFNLAIYVNGTSKSLFSYENVTDNDGVLLLDLNTIGESVSELYIMVDRSGRHDPATYADGLGKTIYLTFEFITEAESVSA